MRGYMCETTDGHSICVDGSSDLREGHVLLERLNGHRSRRRSTRLAILADF